MNTVLAPASLEELVDAVCSTPRLMAIGAGTKARLSAVDAVPLSTAGLRGIREYDPSEFTFTAAAGTPLREIVAALAERGQYLPFDPMLAAAGATLGGTVAAGLSGPGRFRFGGLRDFILGVRFVDGMGRLLRMGGKVVKNAAGFDLPKFFVGSLGRFGVLAEITFKVFPRPPATVTMKLAAGTLAAAHQILTEAAGSRFEFDALDIAPGDTNVLVRLAGSMEGLKAIGGEVAARWPLDAEGPSMKVWEDLAEFRWIHADAPLAKVVLSPAAIVPFGEAMRTLEGASVHVSAGGNVAYVSLSSVAQAVELSAHLQRLGLSGVTLRGAAPLWLGVRARPAIAAAVKQALDPVNRFPSIDD